MGLAVVMLAVAGTRGEEKSISLPDDHPTAKLKAGPGVETVRANCVACHSTDYIVRQPGGDAKKWGAEVKKMIETFGAPISDADAKVIVEYLTASYGPPGEPLPGTSPRRMRSTAPRAARTK